MKKVNLIYFFILLLFFVTSANANEYCYLNDSWNPNEGDDPSLIFSGGTGLVSDPYVITNCVQLQMINCDDARILGSNYGYDRANFVLGGDVNCYDDTRQGGALWFDGQGFDPIYLAPSYNSVHEATFNGNGHKINGVYINRDTGNVGFFGYVQYAVIKNLSVEVDLNLKKNGNTGGLVASAENLVITNCNVSGTIKGRSPVGELLVILIVFT